ncbi:acetyl-CoA carboxylase 1-like [Aedes albopictus]|uniref:Acetyl-coenzyme A carboxylase carboxyl transferase subunit beta domain-containing protein n=1 Tax=Aedes albopictus TaxID=7160 RepID=A0ABM1Z172_AEDAL
MRVNSLLHVYHTVAVHFADLHDTPERMLEKGCINEIVPWRSSRSFFYWRMRRLLLEEHFIKQILDAQDSLSVGQAKSMLRRWFVEDKGATEAYLWENNEPVVEWLENQKKSDSTVSRNIYAVKKDAIISQIQKALEECPEVALDAVVGLCQALSPAHRGEVVKTLSQLEFTEKEHASMG